MSQCSRTSSRAQAVDDTMAGASADINLRTVPSFVLRQSATRSRRLEAVVA